jgi:DNA polymerase elongation subunit (family B)
LSAIPLPFYGNPLLFGRDDTPGLLAFVPADDRVRVHARRDGVTVTAEAPFRPFMLLAEADLLDGFPGEREVIALEGEGAYRWLATFPAWSVAVEAREHCRERSGRSAGDPQGPYLFFSDPVHQYLLRTGRTSFRGMTLGDLRRLALDIEVLTTPGFEFPNAAREGDRIIAIALADSSGWSTVLSGAEMDEAELLRACGRLIAERDPDVIEGHNIFRFDLEYLEARARRHRVPLAWGRGGALLRGYAARMQVAERTISYRRYGLPGRHIVDTWMLAQLYDVSARDLDAYGLKDVARHFGVAAPDRTYLAPEEIPRAFREDPARLMAYARDDVLETLAVSAILSPPYFVQAQALPFDYESVVLRGNATKIDALLLREYLHRGRAVPRAGEGRAVAGGFTAIYQQGVARNVLHVDVTSLYPSLMLSKGILPATDTAGVFGEMLRDLREFRITAKRMAREAPVETDRLLLGALQQTFKILINSFYGYLGTGFGRWNDFEAANRVTSEGRRLVTGLVERLGELGATVIEVDTDGIYFVPPEAYAAPEMEEALLARLAETFPEGLQLELGGRYPAMFSYKMKNYVLLDRGGKLLVKGSGLRSRGIELYLRRWMQEMFRLLLTGRRDEIPALLRRWEADFAARRVPVRLFMKTETLQESPVAYRDKVASGLRNAGAAYELALRAERPYQAGDQVSYYVTGEGTEVMVNEAAKLATAWDAGAPDENTAYYVGKLRELAEKFLPFVERDGLVEVVPEEEPPPAPVQLTLDLWV